jgi:hypothetical protein
LGRSKEHVSLVYKTFVTQQIRKRFTYLISFAMSLFGYVSWWMFHDLHMRQKASDYAMEMCVCTDAISVMHFGDV